MLYAVGDRTWWGEMVSVWPPIGWLAIFGPGIVRWKAWLAAALLAALLVVHGEWPRWGADVPGDLHVVSWNVAGDPRAWESLATLQPDLVLLQEHAGPPPNAWPGYTWVPGFDAAVLSRWPARALPTRRVGPWTEPLLLDVTRPDGSHLLVVDVRLVLPSAVTWVADGLHGSPRSGHALRVGQFPALARLVDESSRALGGAPVVLCGDFTSPATLPSFAPLRALLHDAWDQGGRGWPGTATAGLPLARIDQCWISSGFEAVSVRSRRMPVSDHRLLDVSLRELVSKRVPAREGRT